MISRLDQATLLAEKLNHSNRLAQWDTFLRFSKDSTMARRFFPNSRRLLEPTLAGVRGNHLAPELLAKVSTWFRYKYPTLISDLALAHLSALNQPTDFDLLHGQGNYSLEAALVAKSKGKIFVSDVSGQMGVTRYQQLRKLYESYGMSLTVGVPLLQQRRLTEALIADAITCPSECVADELVKLGIAREKIHLVPYDAPLAKEIISQPRRPHGTATLRIAFAGQISIDKGVHHIISVIKKLNEQGIRCEAHLAGKIIHDFLTRPECPDIHFHGQLSKNKLAELYLSSDLFIFPSYSEGSSLAIIEAMAAGLPVITNSACGSIIRHGENGLLFEAGNESDLLEKTTELACDQDLRHAIGASARKSLGNLMGKSYAETVIKVFDGLLDDNH